MENISINVPKNLLMKKAAGCDETILALFQESKSLYFIDKLPFPGKGDRCLKYADEETRSILKRTEMTLMGTIAAMIYPSDPNGLNIALM